MPIPAELVGCFVVEVGERQAWPFITFCDNRPTPNREVRLYIDSTFDVSIPNASKPAGASVADLLPLNNLAVIAADEGDTSLRIAFDGGSSLEVSAVAQSWTTGDVWWFSPWRP